jgi:hypothetical protein
VSGLVERVMSDAVLAVATAGALVSCMMAGLIWFVQIVHYPLFASVIAGGFVEYERLHRLRTTIVVAPLMLIEAVCAALLALPGFTARRVDAAMAIAGVGLVVLVWVSTFFVQVPLHERLSRGADAALVRRLVRTNWARTALWTAHAVVSVLMLAQAAGPRG